MAEHHLVLPAKLENLDNLVKFVINYSTQIGFSKKRGLEIFLALEEVLVNIISYAYPKGEIGDIAVVCKRLGKRQLLIEIEDSGSQFDPLAKEDPDITLKLGERKPGGLGVYFLKKVIDDISYRYEDGKNILTLKVTDDVFLFIENSWAFQGLEEEDFKELITYFNNVNFKKGDIVISMGEESETMFILRKGKCKVSIPYTTKSGEHVLGYIEKGELVGEIGAITNEKRAATITCMSDAELLTITTENLWKVSEKYPLILKNIMKVSLKKYIGELTKTTSAKERIESELDIARDIQMGLLPNIFPAFPERAEFDIHALIEPAKEVGGDFYDFFMLDDNHICFVMADVSGKGVPAALFMAITKTLIRTAAESGKCPAEILQQVNNDLFRDNKSRLFVTIFLGIIDIQTGEIEFTNGAHNPPLILKSSGEAEFIELPRGLMVGARKGSPYRTSKMMLNEGDSLFMFTDGVTEAMNEQDELYSEARLQKELTALNGESVEAVVNRIYTDIKSFTKSTPQSDDITIMVFSYKGLDTKVSNR